MARLPRLVVPNQPHHVVQRAHDGLVIFRDQQDFGFFLGCLRDAARQFQVAIHAYVLMPDHWHLLATPANEVALARMMQWVGRKYVPYFNNRYARRGTLWEGRYRAVALEAAPYLLMCSLYIELHAVRAQLARAPEDYAWSSYAHHVGLRQDPVVNDHIIYWSLGNTPFEREAAYREQGEAGLSQGQVSWITEATQRGWPIGTDAFKQGLAKQLGRRVEPAARGRPRKREENAPSGGAFDSGPI